MDKFSTTFFKTTEAIKSFSKYPFHIFSQGGMRSGKTVANDQISLLSAMHSEIPIIIKVLGQSVPFLRENVYPDYRMLLAQDGYNFDRLFHKTERTLKIGNTQILFVSVDEDKALGGQHDIVHVVECNARPFTWEIMHQIMARTKMFGLFDFNPKQQFWYHDHVAGNKEFDSKLIKSTYRDNEFIPEGIKRTLENAKSGTNWYRVFVDGELGESEGVIFNNWTYGDFDESLPFCFGVDFGAVDPDAVVKVAYDKKLNNLYVQEMYYQVGNGTEQLVRDLLRLRDAEIERREKLRRYPWSVANRNVPFICDSAGKKMIIDLAGAGINAIPCSKYPDSVRTEIRELQDVNIIVCGESPNLERELNNYIYNDKKSNTPIDSFNHLIDGIRYCWGWITGGANDGVHKR